MLHKCVGVLPASVLHSLAMVTIPLIILYLVFAAPGCKKSQDEPVGVKEGKSTAKTAGAAPGQDRKEKTELPTAVEGEEAVLTLVSISQNIFGLDLKNSTPVRLVQCTINGIEQATVRSTSRTESFLIKFTIDNKKLTILSPSGNTIPPGSGIIAEITCDSAAATISEIKIAK